MLCATLGAAVLALSLSGCARDLELPAVPSGPTLTGFAPAAAHAGQLLRVSGSHLEVDASANTVHFALASARGERWDGADLLVRVPADAGSGPISVANREGTSDPSTIPFDYLGLGEPRRLQLASSSPILQRPRAVHVAGGDVVVRSGLYGGLVWAGNAALTTPPIAASAAAPWDGTGGAVYYATWDAVGGSGTIVRIDAASGLATHASALPAGFEPYELIAVRSADVLAVFGTDGGVEQVGAWDLADLGPRLAPLEYGVAPGSFFGAADVGDGRITLADWDDVEGLTLSLLDLAAGLAGPLPPLTVLASPPPLATNMFDRAPLAVGRAAGANPTAGISMGQHLAAVARDDGRIAIANLDAAAPSFALTVETWSPAAIESIAAAPADGPLGAETGVAIATRPADGLSIGFDLASGTLLWSVPGSEPVAASAEGPLAFVANDDDNDLAVVNLATGARVARVNFDVMPGGPSYAGAAAFVPGSTTVDGDLLFASTAFPGLLRFPLGTGEPIAVSRGAGISFLSSDGAARAVWMGSDGATPRLTGFLGAAWDAPITVELPSGAAPQRTAARGALLVAGHAAGLSMVDGASPPVVAQVAPILDAAAPEFLGLGFTPAGDVWALVRRDLDVQAQLWHPTSIVPGGTPFATWTLPPGTPHGAAWLEDGLWVFAEDDAAGPLATLLDGALSEVRRVAVAPNLAGVHAVSPNGRLLVFREQGTTLGFVLRFFRAEPDAGFPETQTLILEDRVTGFAFDATGERLFVLTQSPDRVHTVD